MRIADTSQDAVSNSFNNNYSFNHKNYNCIAL